MATVTSKGEGRIWVIVTGLICCVWEGVARLSSSRYGRTGSREQENPAFS